jgi:hypothetical protein
MGKLFSKPSNKTSRVADTDRAILTLKQQRDQIVVFRKKLEIQFKQAEDTAKMYDFIPHPYSCHS